jgi:PqqD family protein of HPr-rel-A system
LENPCFHAPAEQSVVRQIGFLYAVFDRSSGRTHLITDVAHALLQAANEPGTALALCERVRSVADVEPEAGGPEDGSKVTEVLLARVAELAELELLKLVS